MKPLKFIMVSISLALCLCSCKKYLDEKPNAQLAVPSTLDDLQLLLDFYSNINLAWSPLGEVLSDNYYLSSPDWGGLPYDDYRNYYLWQKTGGPRTNEYWQDPYQKIFTANVVLDNLDKVEAGQGDAERYSNIKGSALFLRASFFYSLTQLFCKPYDSNTSAADLGIVLRLNSDFNIPSERSSVEESYRQIINDLKASLQLLPVSPLLKTRPGKPAAYGALARTFLAMGDYDRAGLYADSCLRLYDSLINYNTLAASSPTPFTQFNKEVIFDMESGTHPALYNTVCRIDSTLYNSYAADDLRKTVFFESNGNGSYRFKGGYGRSSATVGYAYVFGGIVTDEMFLIRAECKARSGYAADAMADLNTLLQTRWKSGAFTPLTATGAADALGKILAERRKELLFRGTRWTDLRRLNRDPQFAVTIRRLINGNTYTLLPNSSRYTLQIPSYIISTSGIQQNP